MEKHFIESCFRIVPYPFQGPLSKSSPVCHEGKNLLKSGKLQSAVLKPRSRPTAAAAAAATAATAAAAAAVTNNSDDNYNRMSAAAGESENLGSSNLSRHTHGRQKRRPPT